MQQSEIDELERYLDSIVDIAGLKSAICARAQTVYDAWDQDEAGMDEVYGTGGPCQDIASQIAQVISDSGLKVIVIRNELEFEEHENVICMLRDGIFTVDIPPEIYEVHHGLYNWEKKPGVTFTPTDVACELVSRDLTKAELYFERSEIEDFLAANQDRPSTAKAARSAPSPLGPA